MVCGVRIDALIFALPGWRGSVCWFGVAGRGVLDIVCRARSLRPGLFGQPMWVGVLKGELQCKTTQKEVQGGPKTRVSSVLVF